MHEPNKQDATSRILDAFAIYNSQMSPKDLSFIDGCNKTLDTLLVFAGLFSAVVTAFIVQISTGNPQDRTNDLLVEVIKQHLPNSTNYIPNFEKHPETVPSVVVNTLLLCSLTITLLGALMAMLIKQWVFTFGERIQEGARPQEKARSRRQARGAIRRWNLSAIISSVPVLLHIGLALFLLALLVWLYEDSQQSAFIGVLVLVALGFGLYFLALTIGLASERSPFQWPVVSACRRLLRLQRRHRRNVGVPKFAKFSDSILVAVDPRTQGEQILPDCAPEDIAILCQVVEESSYVADSCHAISKLRNIMLLRTFNPRTDFHLADDTDATPCRRRMIIKKCIAVAAESVSYKGGARFLIESAIDQARAVCEFLEVYLQIDWTDDNYYHLLQIPVVSDLLEAFRDYLIDVNGAAGDLVTAVSTLALYSHQIRKDPAGCRWCLDRDTVLGTHILTLEEMLPKEDLGLDPPTVFRAHRFLRVYLTRLTDCLLHHLPSDKDWPGYHICYSEPIHEALEALTQGSEELEQLTRYLEEVKKSVPVGSFEHQWLTAVTPPALVPTITLPYHRAEAEAEGRLSIVVGG